MTQDEAIQMVKDSNGKDSHLLPKVINGNLSLLGYTSLVSLPEGLTVNGDLLLVGCTSLVSLPEGLTVNWSFGLPSLQVRPRGAIGGVPWCKTCNREASMGICRINAMPREERARAMEKGEG